MIEFEENKTTGAELTETLSERLADKRDGVTQMRGAILYENQNLTSDADLATAQTLSSLKNDQWLLYLLLSFYGWALKDPELNRGTTNINSKLVSSAKFCNPYLERFKSCPTHVGYYIAKYAEIVGIDTGVHPFSSLKSCDTFAEIWSSKEALTEICACLHIWHIIRYMYQIEFADAVKSFGDIKIYIIKDGYFYPNKEYNSGFGRSNLPYYLDTFNQYYSDSNTGWCSVALRACFGCVGSFGLRYMESILHNGEPMQYSCNMRDIDGKAWCTLPTSPSEFEEYGGYDPDVASSGTLDISPTGCFSATTYDLPWISYRNFHDGGVALPKFGVAIVGKDEYGKTSLNIESALESYNNETTTTKGCGSIGGIITRYKGYSYSPQITNISNITYTEFDSEDGNQVVRIPIDSVYDVCGISFNNTTDTDGVTVEARVHIRNMYME